MLDLTDGETVEVLLANDSWQKGTVFDAADERTLSIETETARWVIPYENVMAVRREPT